MNATSPPRHARERRSGRDRRQRQVPFEGPDRRTHPDRRHASLAAKKRPGGLPRFLLVAVILFLTISANLPDSMLARLGMDPNILLAALTAVAISGLVLHKHIAVVALVILLSIGANLPPELADAYNINRDYLMAALIGIVILPFVKGWFE